jgi:hypothetical protein
VVRLVRGYLRLPSSSLLKPSPVAVERLLWLDFPVEEVAVVRAVAGLCLPVLVVALCCLPVAAARLLFPLLEVVEVRGGLRPLGEVEVGSAFTCIRAGRAVA